MVEYILGGYLIEKGVISKECFEEVANRLYNEKSKLGAIAVKENILTDKQVRKIHELQKTVDKKFGEIAVQYGGLSQDNLERILKKQREMSKNILTYIEESEVASGDELKCELECFRNEYGLTEIQMEDILDDDIDTIAAVFIKTKNFYTNELYSIALRFVSRFLGDKISLGELRCAEENYCERAVMQKLRTEEANFVIGIAGDRETLHKLNDRLDCFDTQIPENSYSQLFGFLNCISCIFECSIMRELKIQGLSAPALYKNSEFIFSSDGFILPVTVGDLSVDVIVASGINDNFVKVIHNI